MREVDAIILEVHIIMITYAIEICTALIIIAERSPVEETHATKIGSARRMET